MLQLFKQALTIVAFFFGAALCFYGSGGLLLSLGIGFGAITGKVEPLMAVVYVLIGGAMTFGGALIVIAAKKYWDRLQGRVSTTPSMPSDGVQNQQTK